MTRVDNEKLRGPAGLRWQDVSQKAIAPRPVHFPKQALVDYWVRRGYEIVNRRDFEVALAEFFSDREQAAEAAGLTSLV